MKRNFIATSAALATLVLMLLVSSAAMGNTSPETESATAETTTRFMIASVELPEIETNNSATLWFLSDGTLDRLLDEKTAFLEETRPLIHELKSKWATLTEELAKPSSEITTVAHLQNEISNLDTRLAEMRLEHHLTVEDIKASTFN